MRFFDDFQVGDTRDCGSYMLGREEIIAFARQFDPQPFHIDEEAARASPYGGLIASGWHLTAICMRLLVDDMKAMEVAHASLGSPGMDEIRWLRPVRPGDTITISTEVLETTPSRSKPDRGAVRMRYAVRNQHGDTVMTMVGTGLFRRR